jgi:hypothetical protein
MRKQAEYYFEFEGVFIMTRCNSVLEIIEKNAGKFYQSPNKLGKTSIADEMANLYAECKQGEEKFTEIVEEIAMKRSMISSVHKNVLDGTRRRIRSYYWGELQLENYLGSPESISIFAEKDLETKKSRFRVSLEIDGNRASHDELEKHNSLLDLPLEEGCLYGLNEGAAKKISFTKDKVEAKDSIDKGVSQKVQLCVLIEQNNNFSDSEYVQQMDEAIGKIMNAYNHVVAL